MKTLISTLSLLLIGLSTLAPAQMEPTVPGAQDVPPPNRDEPDYSAYDLKAFGELPVLVNGRISPLSSVARNTLLILQNKGSLTLQERQNGQPAVKLDSYEWLAEVLFEHELADNRPLFLVYNPDVLALLESPPANKRRFSFNELLPYFERIEEQKVMAEQVESGARTPYQKAIVGLHANLGLYHGMKNSLKPLGITLEELVQGLDNGALQAMTSQLGQGSLQPGDFENNPLLNAGAMLARGLMFQSQNAYFIAVPPVEPGGPTEDWQRMGDAIMAAANRGADLPPARFYVSMEQGWLNGAPEKFNTAVADYLSWLEDTHPEALGKAEAEAWFNRISPFTWSMVIYILAFIIAAISWLVLPRPLATTAFWLVVFGFVCHTIGLVWRMMLEGRPPVTNLYSSAVFIGWGAVLLGIILERLFRNGIGSATACMVGFATLLVARQLSLDGDTLELMRAVLDSNFWLATHVVIITLGYSAMFLAGTLGIFYILLGIFTRVIDKRTKQSLSRMVYGIICFATLFSVVGTLLGGWWADQSWGRFWGWDPKENGALMIVLWCAIILHARWGGWIRERGLMAMAVFGNVITSWSWFGTNMLGVGLHSYGFTDSAFVTLSSFVVAMVLIIALAQIPLKFWRSFRKPEPEPTLGDAKPSEA